MLDKDELFPCNCCGQCCRRINKAVENLKTLSNNYPELDIDLEFPYSWSEDGVCSMLDENNKCKCYESRPMICNSSEIFSQLTKLGMDKETYRRLSILSCKWLQGYPIKCSENTWKIKRNAINKGISI